MGPKRLCHISASHLHGQVQQFFIHSFVHLLIIVIEHLLYIRYGYKLSRVCKDLKKKNLALMYLLK